MKPVLRNLLTTSIFCFCHSVIAAPGVLESNSLSEFLLPKDSDIMDDAIKTVYDAIIPGWLAARDGNLYLVVNISGKLSPGSTGTSSFPLLINISKPGNSFVIAGDDHPFSIEISDTNTSSATLSKTVGSYYMQVFRFKVSQITEAGQLAGIKNYCTDSSPCNSTPASYRFNQKHWEIIPALGKFDSQIALSLPGSPPNVSSNFILMGFGSNQPNTSAYWQMASYNQSSEQLFPLPVTYNPQQSEIRSVMPDFSTSLLDSFLRLITYPRGDTSRSYADDSLVERCTGNKCDTLSSNSYVLSCREGQDNVVLKIKDSGILVNKKGVNVFAYQDRGNSISPNQFLGAMNPITTFDQQCNGAYIVGASMFLYLDTDRKKLNFGFSNSVAEALKKVSGIDLTDKGVRFLSTYMTKDTYYMPYIYFSTSAQTNVVGVVRLSQEQKQQYLEEMLAGSDSAY